MWVAVGTGTNTILYSSNGSTWTGASCGITTGFSVAFNGNMFVVGGEGTNQLIYSYNGLTWYASINSVFTSCYGVTSNVHGPFVRDTQYILDINGIERTNQMDVTSDSYASGYNNLSLSVRSDTIF